MEGNNNSNLETLENLDQKILSLLGLSLVLTVYLNVKPVCDVTIQAGDVLELDKKTKKFKEVLSRLGLKFKESYQKLDNSYITDEKDLMHFSISKSGDNFTSRPDFSDSKLSEQERKEKHIEYGTALGFPKTAVQAFIDGTTYKIFELVDILSPEEFAFLYFAPSKAHLKEELELVHSFAEKTKVASPKLYQILLNNANELYDRVKVKEL